MELMERENEILKTIQTLADHKLDFVMVGGYAVSALARHRFSFDCDIAISRKRLDSFKISARAGELNKCLKMVFVPLFWFWGESWVSRLLFGFLYIQ